jgi:succinate-semialdehyde dehydrogenase/glutarate-semialdehyde dehydrogenase
VVQGAGALGSLVARSEGVDAVVFTGSTRVGRELQAELAALQRPAHFQLGGADPVIVCDDANLERAANATVFGRFSNNGQSCAAVKRVYVQRTVADAFVHKVMHKVRALKSGPYTNPFCELGPLANGRNLQHLRAVLQDALDRRAELVAGGFPAHVTGPRNGERRGAERQGWYWPPTVIRTVDHSMRVMKEPLCGPILPIQVFEDDGEAILLANDTAFGFDASIFSADPARAQKIAGRLQAGRVVVNDLFVHGAVPVAHAGAARNDGGNEREPHWFPYSAAKLHAIEQAMGVPPRGVT